MLSINGKKWKLLSDEELGRQLASDLGCPVPIGCSLVARGLTTVEDATTYFEPKLSELSDPFAFSDMQKAVVRIWEAIEAHEKIVIHGDYDVDGLTSTALMIQVLAALGADVAPFIPHRIHDGYGLSEHTLHQCMETFMPGLIITVDCGTGSHEAVKEAWKLGVDVIITDHHEPGETKAKPLALINPKTEPQPDERWQALAGVGVAFKVAHALVKFGRKKSKEKALQLDLKRYLYLVSLGTIADMVPLTGENRILSSIGMKQLNQENPSPGLTRLLDVAGSKGRLTSYHVGFVIGPRLNASGRLEHGLLGLELLLSRDPERINLLASQLEETNLVRREVERQTLEEALSQLDIPEGKEPPPAIVVAGEGWHPGVVGIVASRLKDRFFRPSIAIALGDEGKGKGSGRSIPGLDLVQLLKDASDHLLTYGGHQMAAGLELETTHLDAFKDAFSLAVLNATTQDTELYPELNIDGCIQVADINWTFMGWQQKLEPFGMNNKRSRWLLRQLRVMDARTIAGKHIKLYVADDTGSGDIMAFGMAEVDWPPVLDAVVELHEREFKGKKFIQAILKDWNNPQTHS